MGNERGVMKIMCRIVEFI